MSLQKAPPPCWDLLGLAARAPVLQKGVFANSFTRLGAAKEEDNAMATLKPSRKSRTRDSVSVNRDSPLPSVSALQSKPQLQINNEFLFQASSVGFSRCPGAPQLCQASDSPTE